MDVSAVSVPGGQTRADSKAEREQIAHLAQEFEAMFISEMMRGMRESLLSEEDAEGLGADTMTDTFDTEFGRSMSSAGGLGLASVMLEGLRKLTGDASGTAPASAPISIGSPAAASSLSTLARSTIVSSAKPRTSASSILGAVADTPADVTRSELTAAVEAHAASQESAADWASVAAASPVRTLPGPVTSKFGWRADPFSGRPQFHAGTDIRLAYGHDVQSVAAGRVRSVDEQSGYGLTVVIDHGHGIETRYAHLSKASVKAGERVDSGQVVARSGNSGRSTGPHLHLEARRNGRAVEMAALLKSPALSADSYADDRSIVRSGHED